MERLVITVPKTGLIYRDTEENSDYIITTVDHVDPQMINIRWESTNDSPLASPYASPIATPIRSLPSLPSPIQMSPTRLPSFRGSSSLPSPIQMTPTRLPSIGGSPSLTFPSPIRTSTIGGSPYRSLGSPMQLTPTIDGRIVTSSPVISNTMSPVRSLGSSRHSFGSPRYLLDQEALMSSNPCGAKPLIIEFEPKIRIKDINFWKNLLAQFGAFNTVEISHGSTHDSLSVVYDNIDAISDVYTSLDSTYMDTPNGQVVISVLF